jgi:CheY-like chemotaxis protein
MTTRNRNPVPQAVRVLVADESHDDLDLLVPQLRKSHMDGQVKIIPDGKLAWNFLTVEGSEANLVAIFLDLQLPSLSGFKLLCRIKSHPQLRSIPVIIMTSTNKITELEDCVRLGVNCFIPKPVTFAAFIKAVADTFHHVPRGALTRIE